MSNRTLTLQSCAVRGPKGDSAVTPNGIVAATAAMNEEQSAAVLASLGGAKLVDNFPYTAKELLLELLEFVAWNDPAASAKYAALKSALITGDPGALYTITNDDMERSKGLSTEAPDYTLVSGSAVCYADFDLLLDAGTYAVEWECNKQTAGFSGKIYNSSALTQVSNSQNITALNVTDLGKWFDYDEAITFTVGSGGGALRFQIRQNGSQALTDDFRITYVKIKEVAS